MWVRGLVRGGTLLRQGGAGGCEKLVSPALAFSTIDYYRLLLFVKQDCTATLCTFRSENPSPKSSRLEFLGQLGFTCLNALYSSFSESRKKNSVIPSPSTKVVCFTFSISLPPLHSNPPEKNPAKALHQVFQSYTNGKATGSYVARTDRHE